MRDTGLPPRGYPGGHRHVRALHRARLAALRGRSSRARRDRSSSAAAPSSACRTGISVRPDLARALAAGFLAGEWSRPGLGESGAAVLGRRPRWLAPLARQVLDLYPRPPHDRPRELATNIVTRPAAAKAVGARAVGAARDLDPHAHQPLAAPGARRARRRRGPRGRHRVRARLVRRPPAPGPGGLRRTPPALPGQPLAWQPAARFACSRRPSDDSRKSSGCFSTRSRR